MTDLKNTHSIHKNLFELLFIIDLKMKEIIQEEDSGLSMLQISILRILATDGEMSLIDVAQKTNKDKSQITRVIQDLVKKGILRKERSEFDRRSFILKLNPGVKDKMSFYMMKEQGLVAEMLSGVTDKDQHSLDKTLLQMHENLKRKSINHKS